MDGTLLVNFYYMKKFLIILLLCISTASFAQEHSCNFVTQANTGNGSLLITCSCNKQVSLKFTVYNYQGKEVSYFIYPMSKGLELLQLNLKYFSPGLYSVTVDDGSYIAKFNIEKR